MEKMLRVTASDFCAGAVFEDNEDFHFICTKAAPKLGALLNMDLASAP